MCEGFNSETLFFDYASLCQLQMYIGPSVMTEANCEGFPTCDDRITENDRCVIKIIDVFPIIFHVRGLRPDMLRFPCVCVMTFTLGL